MIKTPLINIRPILSCGGCNCCNCNEDAVEPNIVTIEDGEDPNDLTFVRGDLLDALSVNVYFNDMKSQLLSVLDVVSTQLRNHVSDKNVHTSQTEKAYWNSKLDKTEFSESINGLRNLIPTNAITSATLADALEALGLLDATHNPIVIPGGEGGTIDQSTINTITNRVINSISYMPVVTSQTADSYLMGYLNIGNSTTNIYGKDSSAGSSTGNDYSITSLSYNNGLLTINQNTAGTKTVSIPTGSGNIVPATASVLGGIKIGYTENGRNFAVKLDSNNKAYVTVPGGSSTPGTGVDGGYWEIIFKATETEDTPSVPADFDNNPEGWSHNAQNSDGSLIVWMTTRWVSGTGEKGSWQTPWRISGVNGENGIDGTYYEYIYKTTTTQDVPNLSTTAVQEDDFVPSGWNDNAQGVDPTNKYEWMAYRRKTYNSNNQGTWSQFYGPVLWSSYGRNGTDGDGIEYIFYLDEQGDKVFGNNASDNPKNWFDEDENSHYQTDREYIAANSGWTDDPETMTVRGSKIYVSIRKRYEDEDSQHNVRVFWHAYSQPALWAYYAKDGTIDNFDPNEINNKIDGFELTLDELQNDIDTTVTNTVSERLADATWMRTNFPWGQVFNYSGWDDGMQSYLQGVGLIQNDGSVGWSTLSQTVTSILGKVTALENGDHTMTGTEIITALDDTEMPYTDMYSFYTDLDDDGNILKRLVSGFKSAANQDSTMAAQFANSIGENSSGLATVVSTVNTLGNKVTNVEAGLAARMTTEDATSLIQTTAGTVATATANSAISTLFAEGVSGTNSEKLRATISTVVTEDNSLIELIAQHVDIQGYLTAGDATFTGTVKAKLVYPLTKDITINGTGNYQIGNQADGMYSSYKIGFSKNGSNSYDYVYTMILPNPTEYVGLELVILNHNTDLAPTDNAKIKLQSYGSTDNIFCRNFEDLNPSQYSCYRKVNSVYVAPNDVVTLKSFGSSSSAAWYITSGLVALDRGSNNTGILQHPIGLNSSNTGLRSFEINTGAGDMYLTTQSYLHLGGHGIGRIAVSLEYPNQSNNIYTLPSLSDDVPTGAIIYIVGNDQNSVLKAGNGGSLVQSIDHSQPCGNGSQFTMGNRVLTAIHLGGGKWAIGGPYIN